MKENKLWILGFPFNLSKSIWMQTSNVLKFLNTCSRTLKLQNPQTSRAPFKNFHLKANACHKYPSNNNHRNSINQLLKNPLQVWITQIIDRISKKFPKKCQKHPQTRRYITTQFCLFQHFTGNLCEKSKDFFCYFRLILVTLVIPMFVVFSSSFCSITASLSLFY